MARRRSSDEILDEATYAAALAIAHYGPALNEEGLEALRKAISEAAGPAFWCDSSWCVDIPDGDEKDFHELLPADQSWLSFEDFCAQIGKQ